jgi:hypothetical protein
MGAPKACVDATVLIISVDRKRLQGEMVTALIISTPCSSCLQERAVID